MFIHNHPPISVQPHTVELSCSQLNGCSSSKLLLRLRVQLWWLHCMTVTVSVCVYTAKARFLLVYIFLYLNLTCRLPVTMVPSGAQNSSNELSDYPAQAPDVICSDHDTVYFTLIAGLSYLNLKVPINTLTLIIPWCM